MARTVERIEVVVDGTSVVVERLDDGTFRKPSYLAGAERDVVGVSPNWRDSKRDRERFGSMEVRGENAGLLMGPPLTDEAKQFAGYGTALKPGWEPFIVGVKPQGV